MKYQKIFYMRDKNGQYVAGISLFKLTTIGLVIVTSIIGTLYSVLYAPMAGAITQDEIITKAIDSAHWKASGSQYGVSGNVIFDVPNADSGQPAIYVGDSIDDLYKFKEWELKNALKDVDTWKTKANEPTAVLTRVCRVNGVSGSDCPKTLFAMAMQESVFGKEMVGDGGRSTGWFHIMDYNRVPNACALDLECSANWSLKRLIRFGYPAYRSIAIMAHNGTPNTKTTKDYLAAVNSKMALWPN